MVSTVSPARRAAFEVLRDVNERRGEPKALLHASKWAKLAAADRDLMTELTYGVLRWRNCLDFILTHHSKRPLEAIDPVALAALRLGLYQLRFLTRVPPHAAVDQSVKLSSSFGARRAAPFVNAVLRSVTRSSDEPKLPDEKTDPLGFLTHALSHPRWLVERYVQRHGFDRAKALCRIQNEPPPLHIRLSHRAGAMDHAIEELARQGVTASLISGASRALEVVKGSPSATSFYRDGLLYIQDAGSQSVAGLVAPSSTDWVVDLCAAPGGKAMAIADALPRGIVLALDRRPRRAAVLRSNRDAHGLENLRVVVSDARAAPLGREFPRVLVDAPCSSSGTLRRNPDVKWRLSAKALRDHAELQLALLDAAAELVAPGGRLVYATCSSEPEENEDVVAAFTKRHSRFRVRSAKSPFARADGALETRPERDGMDAYFARVLAKD